MRIATWNVNSIKQRIENLTAWLKERQPDVVCLQETKCVDDSFPRLELEALGYNVAFHGQKAFNGVAILSKYPFDEVTAAPAGRGHRRAGPLPRGHDLGWTGVWFASPRSTCPTAIRSIAKSIHIKSDGWIEFLIIFLRHLN